MRRQNENNMEIKSLKIFISIAEGGKLTEVADAFGLSKSTASYILNNIEREIGAELFVPGGKHMQMTECGSLFLVTAKKTVAAYDEGMEAMQSLRDDVSGDLRIGVGSFVEPVIRKAVAKLLKEHPALNIDAHVYRANTLNQMLKAGKLDVAFTLNRAYDGEGIISELCIPVKIVAVMSKTHELARKDKVTFDELCRYDCIMPSEDKRALNTITTYFGKDKDLTRLRRRIKINTADGALNMVEEENYITFMTVQHIVNRPHLVAKPIEGLEMELTSNMHYLEGVHIKKSVTLLRDTLKEYAIPILNMMTI